MNRLLPLRAALVAAACASTSLLAAEASPPDAPRPVTTARIGGSPADLAFRNAQLKAGDDYRAAKAQCNTGAKSAKSACLKAARATLKQDQRAAKAAHAVGR